MTTQQQADRIIAAAEQPLPSWQAQQPQPFDAEATDAAARMLADHRSTHASQLSQAGWSILHHAQERLDKETLEYLTRGMR